ncbi:MAG: GNAT family N-acetyltransferase [Bacteroidetes bacterium]|nr:GNAT family N-acetyltransferase [Bacteroidota bacterium]
MNIPFETDIILENEYARLTPLQLTHVPDLLPVAIQDETLIQYSPAQIHSEVLLTSYINNILKEKGNKTRYAFAIYDKVRNAYAGSTSYLNINQTHKRLEIGSTWIGRDFQKSQLNRNCKLLLLSYAFEQADAERVEFLTDQRNLVSQKAIEGIGARFEGILRSHITMLDGYRRNSMCYSIIKSEWPDVKENLINTLNKYPITA